ncbi:MAG: O-antigen ligase family protein [Ruminococcaceae bacterium]|nr:O-antigen ligase family protein [Oscillospiraceae bacterium]
MNVKFDSIRIKAFDWLLIVGLCLAPMTGFRIWKVGPGEILCLIWGLKYLFTRRIVKSDVFRFFSLFIFFVLIGTLVGFAVAPNELRLADLFTWLYLAVFSSALYDGLKTKSLEYNEKLLFVFARFATLWYLFLYVFSLTVRRTFFGAPLWYSGARFSGGGTNPHQVALLLCGLIFVFVCKMLKRQSFIKCFIYLSVCLFLLYQTASSTGYLAVAISFVWVSYFLLLNSFPNHKKLAVVIFTLLLVLIAVVGFPKFYEMFMSWVSKDSNGLGRIDIFASYPDTFVKSPLFGLGPGAHGINGYIEFHNTYLEVLSHGGLFAGVVFLIYSIRIYKKTLMSDWKMSPILVVMYAYGLGGFAMRRIVYWCFVIFVTVIAEQMNSKMSRTKNGIITGEQIIERENVK